MFNPSRDQVREFFIETWEHRATEVLTPLESMALDWILEHPEYHGDLESPEAMTAEYPVEHGRTNPFLHLSMHLAIAEQLSIDHPRGIRAAYQRLVGRVTRTRPPMKSWNAWARWYGRLNAWYAARQRRLHRADPPARRAPERKSPGSGLARRRRHRLLAHAQVVSCAASQAATLRMSWSEQRRERAHDRVLAHVGRGRAARGATLVGLERMRQVIGMLAGQHRIPGWTLVLASAPWQDAQLNLSNTALPATTSWACAETPAVARTMPGKGKRKAFHGLPRLLER